MHAETQTEWECRMFGRILDYLRDELCIDLPHLERALAALVPEGNERLTAFATEGLHLYFPPARYLQVFEENELFLRRAYLHTVLHCLYAHLWQRNGRQEARWNLACDIAVEYVIDGLDKPSTKRLQSWLRQQFYAKMEEQHIFAASGIYELLLSEKEEACAQLAGEYYCDDHALWGETQKKSPMPNRPEHSDEAQKKWQRIARQVQLQKEKAGQTEDAAAAALKEAVREQRRHRSYRDFLRRFASFHEELRSDPDTFDLNFYTYGLQVYGNLPLIEPVETREERRIREFVIAVDTSYSTSGELVRGFLQETLHILLEEHAFFTTVNVHLIQCDDAVQDDLVIHNVREAAELLADYEIRGGGGTDFRPVFTYVERLRASGALKQIGGLLYFTDGNGTYPAKKPDYPCAFLYMDDYDEQTVPPWAIRRRVDASDAAEKPEIRRKQT